MFIVLIATVPLLPLVFADIHHQHVFKKFTDMGVSTNWQAKRVPCGSQVIQFPEELRHEVLWDINVSPKTVYFPLNGKIVFASEIVIGGEPTCTESHGQSEKAEYAPPANPHRFLDHRNWRYPDDAILDVEKVPNSCSAAVFNPNHTYYVSVGTPTFLGELQLLGKKARSPDDLRKLMEMRAFQDTFKGIDEIDIGIDQEADALFTISDDIRDNQDGCFNSNLRQELMQEVFRTEPDCSSEAVKAKTICSATIQPIGNKCRICGAQILIRGTEGVKLDIDQLREDISYNAKAARARASLMRTDLEKLEYQVVVIQDRQLDVYEHEEILAAFNDIQRLLKSTSGIQIISTKISAPFSVNSGLLATLILLILFILSAVGYVLSKLWNRKIAATTHPGLTPVYSKGAGGDDQLELSMPKDTGEGTFSYKQLLESDDVEEEL